jgi:hypothetical protein
VPPEVGEGAVPQWLLDLATACSGKRLSEAGMLVDALDVVARIEEIRRTIATLPAGAPFADWGHWMIADRSTRRPGEPAFVRTCDDSCNDGSGRSVMRDDEAELHSSSLASRPTRVCFSRSVQPQPPSSSTAMKLSTVSSALAVLGMFASPLAAQPPASAPDYYQSLSYVKTAPGKNSEYVQLLRDTVMKSAQIRADAGEIVSWTLLRAVYPDGEEARANYLISVISERTPQRTRARDELAADFKKAGVTMKADDYIAKRDNLRTLIATEMWRPRVRVAAPAKGHFLFLNMRKVHDAAAYIEFENTMWRPMAEEWVRQGAMSGWIFATKVLPAGTETVYTAYSADMFPSWAAAFATRAAQPIFEKVHAGKNYQEFSAKIPKLRDLARREMWEVIERVEKKK